MNTIKTAFVVVVLMGVCYGVYTSVMTGPEAPKPPAGVDEDWSEIPEVDFGDGMDGGPVPLEGTPSDQPPMEMTEGDSFSGAFAPPQDTMASENPGAPFQDTATTAYPANYGTASSEMSEEPGPVAVPEEPGNFANHGTPAATENTYPSAADVASYPDTGYGATSPIDSDPNLAGTSNAQAITPADEADNTTQEFEKAFQDAQQYLVAGDLAAAHKLLSMWYAHPSLSQEQSGRLLDLLDQLAGAVVYSREHLLESPHVVQAGETLETIGQRYGIPGQLLAKINGIADAANLAPGQELKVLRGPFASVVNLSGQELTLLVDGHYAGRFPLQLAGSSEGIEAGQYEVQEKIADPTYYPPEGGVYPASSPENPYGSRWIGLGGELGIHGSSDSTAQTANPPRGSIRLSQRDVEDVFDILSVGSQVIILR